MFYNQSTHSNDLNMNLLMDLQMNFSEYEKDNFHSLTSSIDPLVNEQLDHFFDLLDVLAFHSRALETYPDKHKQMTTDYGSRLRLNKKKVSKLA